MAKNNRCFKAIVLMVNDLYILLYKNMKLAILVIYYRDRLLVTHSRIDLLQYHTYIES